MSGITLNVPVAGPFTVSLKENQFILTPPTELVNDTIILQAAQQGPPGSSGSTVTNSAPAAVSISAGAPVIVNASGLAVPANAATFNTAFAVGLAGAATNTGFACPIKTDSLTLANWTAVIGSTGLTSGALYFLSTVAGQMTTTPPVTPGQCVVVIGKAISTTTLELELTPPLTL